MTNTSRFMLCILRNSQEAHLNCTVWVKFSVKPPSVKFRIIPFGNCVLVTCRQTDRQTRRSYECSFATCHGGIAKQCLWRSLHCGKRVSSAVAGLPQQMWIFFVTRPWVQVNRLRTHQIKYHSCRTGCRCFCLGIFSRCGFRRFAPNLYVSGLA